MSGEKKLYRSLDDRMLAGICGGLGEYLGLDPTIVRVIFVLIAFFAGGGILLYLILWFLIPEAPAGVVDEIEEILDDLDEG